MRALLDSPEFRAELSGWLLRGVLCAASSAAWAVILGFQAPVEYLGMATGLAFWVAVFAAVCALMPVHPRWKHSEAVGTLKWAAGIKIGLTVAGWLFLIAGKHLAVFAAMGVFVSLDMLLGLAALAAVAWIAGVSGPEQVAAADSFGLTILTTVIEGALMALVILVIAVGVWTMRRLWPGALLKREVRP